MQGQGRPLVAGVVPGTAAVVLGRVAELAQDLRGELIVVHVDTSRYVVQRNPDGSQLSLPVDPDLEDAPDPRREAALRGQTEDCLAGYRLPWSFRMLAGEPAHELAMLAARLDARMIAVGTRKRGVRRRVEEFFTGSVAVQLTHSQPLPVFVVPTDPGAAGRPLPWE